MCPYIQRQLSNLRKSQLNDLMIMATTKHTLETSLYPNNKHMKARTTTNITTHTLPGRPYSLLHTPQCTISLMAPLSSRIGMEYIT